MEIGWIGYAFCFQIILNLIEKSVCIPAWCPPGRYPSETGCSLCYQNCGQEGCTGPASHLGPGGCSSCWLGLEQRQGAITCMSPFSSCPSGYYLRRASLRGEELDVCKPCHPLCSTCSGAGISNCESCRFFRWDGACVKTCPSGSVLRGRRRTCVLFGGNHTSRRRPFYPLPFRDRYRQ